MFCKACGNQLPDGAVFCANCGVPVAPTELPPPPPTAETEAATTQVKPRAATPPDDAPTMVRPPQVPLPPPPAYVPTGPSGAPGPYGAPQPPRKSRLGLWIGLASAAAILIAAGLVLWLVVFDKDDESEAKTTTTAATAGTTSTAGLASTTTSAAASSTSTSAIATTATTLATIGDPGDSSGEWVEVDNSAFPERGYAVAVSDVALLIDAEADDGYALYAYMLDSGDLIELPVDANDFFNEDIEGDLAIWWEGDYQEDTDEYLNERVCAYRLPDGPKIYVTDEGRAPYYPQLSGQWLTWAEATPWEENPDEYSFVKIFGVEVTTEGEPEGDPAELVYGATSYNLGDSTWAYSLSGTHLAWENATAVEGFEPGLYTMDLGRFQPTLLETEAWRPSLSGDTLVYYGDGLMARNLSTDDTWQIDPLGDFATAAPTFAAYYRAVEGDETTYEIVARGYTGGNEQVLGEQYDAPWMSPFIAASANHVAFIVDGTVHLFEWDGPITH
ncbi:MAG: zinc ribbon domain-containing protein [Thermoleophilia bacterium]|nr:zinc ribbon domain-containing protein [Thermoleophilia bacterium]